MKYFQQLPKIQYTDFNGNYLLLTNLLVRANIIPKLLANPLLFYSYELQEGDTPEIVASKYYGTVDDFWLVMFANQLLDPQWDWPLTYQNFNSYIVDKYGSLANAQGQIIQYTMTTTTTDLLYGTSNPVTTIIDAAAFANTITGTTSATLPSGDIVSITVNTQPVFAYDYEYQMNESKRNINLINSTYAPTVKSQLKTLLGR
jgi:hypothetical protein